MLSALVCIFAYFIQFHKTLHISKKSAYLCMFEYFLFDLNKILWTSIGERKAGTKVMSLIPILWKLSKTVKTSSWIKNITELELNEDKVFSKTFGKIVSNYIF